MQPISAKKPHRSESHSRLDDWLANLPETGVREMCSWERFCAFAREPERRKVGSNARLTVEGTVYEVDPDLAGEPKLTRHGYDMHNLAEQFNAKPAEIRRFLRGELDAARTRELTDEMLAAGLPI